MLISFMDVPQNNTIKKKYLIWQTAKQFDILYMYVNERDEERNPSHYDLKVWVSFMYDNCMGTQPEIMFRLNNVKILLVLNESFHRKIWKLFKGF